MEQCKGPIEMHPGLSNFLATPEGRTVTDAELAALVECCRELGGRGFGADPERAAVMWRRWLALTRYGSGGYNADHNEAFASLCAIVEARMCAAREHLFQATHMRSPEAAREAMKLAREEHAMAEALISTGLRLCMNDVEQKHPALPTAGAASSHTA